MQRAVQAPERSASNRALGGSLRGTVVALPTLGFFAVFLIYPLTVIVIRSLTVDGGVSLDPSTYTIANYQSLFGDPAFRRIIANTFSIALWTAVISLALGYPLAYVLASLPRRQALVGLLLVLSPALSPVLMRLYAWTQLLGRRGIVNEFLLLLGMQEPLPLLHNRPAALIGTVHYLLPYMVVILYAGMSTVDRSLLSAARTLGASERAVFVRVFAPLTKSSVGAGLLLVFSVALGFLLTPAILGGPGDMTMAVYIQQQVELVRWGVASAMGVTLLAVGLIALACFEKLFGFERLIAARSAGLASQESPIALMPNPVARWVTGALAVAVLVFLIGPLLIVVLAAFTAGPFLAFPPEGLSLRWFREFSGNPAWISSLQLSVRVVLVATVLAVLLGALNAIAVVRVLGRSRAVFRMLLVSPVILPLVLIGMGLFDIYSDLGLTGTIPGFVIAHTLLAVPFTSVVLIMALQRVPKELEEAGMTMGASKLRVYARVSFPLVLPAVVGAGIFAFLVSWDEVVVTLFVITVDMTLPVRMFSFLQTDLRPTLAAVSVVLMAVIMGVACIGALAQRWLARASRQAPGVPTALPER